MKRLRSIDDLQKLRQKLAAERDPDRPVIIIPAGTCGQAGGANDLIRVAKRELLKRRLATKVALRVTGCHGYCEMEPSLLVEPRGTFYPKVGMKEMERIVEAVAAGKVLTDLLYLDPQSGERIERQSDLPFFRRQRRAILGRNEKVDPIRIGDYLQSGGYDSLARVLAKRDPRAVLEKVKASGLRGRGGAGFPTGQKWELLAQQPAERGKVLICNADEGDPGAYMDRSVLEGNPHSIIEGMIIGAYATGAREGVIYVRAEYPLAIKNLLIALRQAREMGLLGDNILGSGFSFDLQVVKGAGAFVCGEETALIRSIEGKIGEPRQRPPFPVQRGVDRRPTAINNVETWANIPLILAEGASQFAKVGTAKSTGTKIFSLVGKIRNTGLVEVPMGMSIGEIVRDIGGGPSSRAQIKAVQTGGPSGGCIPSQRFDLPIDYDSLKEAGSIMGSGGMIVMDENTCMVDVAKYFMSFLKDESCGKCFTCRKGTQRMYELLDDISRGRGTPETLLLLEELAQTVRDTTMCGLGQSAANPVLSTLRYFREEYQRHIWDKRCDAFVCKDLVGAPCQAACPIGTEAWRYVAHIRRGEYEEAYRVIRQANPFPSVCARVCDHPCEERCRLGTSGDSPVAVRALKRFITDRIDPLSYKPLRPKKLGKKAGRVAIIGAGPAGLTAAHYLSLAGHQVTIFESEAEPGGMLFGAIPAYRLPRDLMRREIASLLDENVTLKCNVNLGRDLTLDGLFKSGYQAIFLALGAHQSKRLKIAGEDAAGVIPSIQFLNAFNLKGQALAKGRVGVIGGGNSALDAARVALRQKGVHSVTIFYRRTREEMPAFAEEVEAALAEGVHLETLVSPLRIETKEGRLSGLVLQRNRLGEADASGRRRPLPIPGSEHSVPLDTLIAAISEGSDVDSIALASANQIAVVGDDRVQIDPETLLTNRPGVFAGGDVVRGPSTVVRAIADGKRAAQVIDRYLRQEELKQPGQVRLPEVFVEPEEKGEEWPEIPRTAAPSLPAEARKKNFNEVEMPLTVEQATAEAGRCLRCDLDFTRPAEAPPPREGKRA